VGSDTRRSGITKSRSIDVIELPFLLDEPFMFGDSHGAGKVNMRYRYEPTKDKNGKTIYSDLATRKTYRLMSDVAGDYMADISSMRRLIKKHEIATTLIRTSATMGQLAAALLAEDIERLDNILLAEGYVSR